MSSPAPDGNNQTASQGRRELSAASLATNHNTPAARPAAPLRPCRLWVRPGKARAEQNESALPRAADTSADPAGSRRRGQKLPHAPEPGECYSITSSAPTSSVGGTV